MSAARQPSGEPNVVPAILLAFKGRLANAAASVPVQMLVATTLVGWTGWVVGVAKLTQVMMTADDGIFPTKSEAAAQSFLITFGMAKAVSNMLVGAAADAYGRQPCMVVGWLAGVLLCAVVMSSNSWSAIVWADLFLGINQGCCWSAALFVAVDLLGPGNTALAIGLIETVGYLGLALASPVVSFSRHDLGAVRAWYLIILVISSAGLALSLFLLRETRSKAHSEQTQPDAQQFPKRAPDASDAPPHEPRRRAVVLEWPSGRRESHPLPRAICAYASCIDARLMSCCLVGIVLNFSTAYAWGAMSRWLTQEDSPSKASAGLVLLSYSLPKGVVQLFAGVAADRRLLFGWGPVGLVIFGLLTLAMGLLYFTLYAAAEPGGGSAELAAPLAVILGTGTAFAYSPVMACVAARAEPAWRAGAVGVYRFWRDSGFAFGGLVLGVATDQAKGAPWVAPLFAAIAVLAAATFFGCTHHEPRHRIQSRKGGGTPLVEPSRHADSSSIHGADSAAGNGPFDSTAGRLDSAGAAGRAPPRGAHATVVLEELELSASIDQISASIDQNCSEASGSATGGESATRRANELTRERVERARQVASERAHGPAYRV